MRGSSLQLGSDTSLLPEYIVSNNEGKTAQKSFSLMRTALPYLDQWGAISSANIMAKELLRDE
jgi:hypothetical protein